MDLHLLVGVRPLLVVVDLWILAMIGLAYPMSRDHGDDQGDGMALVLLPRPALPRARQTIAFASVFVALNVLYHSATGPHSPDRLYAAALQSVVDRVVIASADVHGYLSNFGLGLRMLVLGAMVSLALTCRAGLLRRFAILLQCLWYVAAVFLFDCLLAIFSVLTHAGVGPGTMFGNWFAFFVGFVGMARILYGNFALPKPTRVPFKRRPRFADAVVLVGTTTVGMCAGLVTMFVLYNHADPRFRPVIGLLSPIPFAYITTVVRDLLLALMGMMLLRQPPIGSDRPPIDVIIPAYNEEAVIADTLKAIDAAAVRYGGPVNVILTDDGSTDRTRPLVEATMAAFRAASGRIVDGPHGGKSAALNLALSNATSDLIVRIDADTIIDDKALVHLPRWFRDPTIGLVEALMWPRGNTSVFHRMRLFEELRVFAVHHRVLQNVDAINVVPGVFTAFRRQPAVELGGFTVGMNGEDGDFTLRMSRLGWKTRLDPKIVIYEDVPPTFREIREQRVRWCRATIHNQARHGSYRAGLATPKVWFSQTRQYFARCASPIAFMLPFYIAIYAIFEGTYRTGVVIFVAAFIVSQINIMFINGILAAGYGFGRRAGWTLVWPFWQMSMKMFSTESILSLPGRPLNPFAPKQVIREAVVH